MKTSLAWEIPVAGAPNKLSLATVKLEEHLEDWIDADISIIADDVILIGRQVKTAENNFLDLLGLDRDGKVVVIELKKDKTLRDTIAQGLDYAEWCYGLTEEQVLQFGADRFGSEDLFRKSFVENLNAPFPEQLNSQQRIVLVAPTITDRTARVIGYMANVLRVPINAVDFDVFELDGKKVLVRHVVVEEDQQPKPGSPPKAAHRTLDEFMQLAAQNGVAEIFSCVLGLKDLLPSAEPFLTSYAMKAKTKAPDKRVLAGLTMYPTGTGGLQGIVHLLMSPDNVSALYGLTVPQAEAFIRQVEGAGEEGKGWSGWIGMYIKTVEQAEEFVKRYRAAVMDAINGAAPEVSQTDVVS